MQSEFKPQLEKIIFLLRKIEQAQSLVEFETIQLPFELVEMSLNLWQTLFQPEVFRQLVSGDTETLEAWAIALAKTLATQLNILDTWVPQLSTFPVPASLQQKICDRVESLRTIAQERSQILQHSTHLFNQDFQLRQDAADLQALKAQANQLQLLETGLQATNLDHLRQSIAEQTAKIEPERQILLSLQQQKADLDEQIHALQRQQGILREEINYWDSRKDRLETQIASSVTELITLTQIQREQLSTALAAEMRTLEQARTELIQQQEIYQQVQADLQEARTDFQTYENSIAETRNLLTTHYQADQTLAQWFPQNRQAIDYLLNTLEQTLAELDQELTTARQQQEQTQLKTRFTF